jgi:hypothetical protein
VVRPAGKPALDPIIPRSARLGEMVVLDVENISNVEFVSWRIEPPPDSFRVADKFKQVPGTEQFVPDGPLGREAFFSSTTVGDFTVYIAYGGRGGVNSAVQHVIYGTAADGNALASARQNFALDDNEDFEAIMLRALRAVDDGKADHRLALADAIDDVVALASEENPHVTRREEVPAALNQAAQRRLRTSYADWTRFLRTLTLVLSDAVNNGDIKTLDDELKVLRATALILRR